MSVADEIEKLSRLKQAGTLSPEEFETAKSRLLAGTPPPARREERSGIGLALWVLVGVVFVGAAGLLVLIDEASESLRMIAGAAALGAGTLGGILAVMEDFSFAVTGGLGLGALCLAAIAFTGAGPILILGLLAVLACGAVVTWWSDLF
jgi:hypothetical protein